MLPTIVALAKTACTLIWEGGQHHVEPGHGNADAEALAIDRVERDIGAAGGGHFCQERISSMGAMAVLCCATQLW